jgi:hypothetical protein
LSTLSLGNSPRNTGAIPMSSKAAEYRVLIEEILAGHVAAVAQGLPGIDEFDLMEIRDLIARAERSVAAKMSEDALMDINPGWLP